MGPTPQPPTSQSSLRGLTLTATRSDALTPVECALDRFFERMNARSVPVLALRGARNAPYYRTGGDLDLACPDIYRETVLRALEREIKAFGLYLVSVHHSRYMDQFQLYAPCGPGHHHHLCIDLHTSETALGVPFLDAKDLLRGRSTRKAPHRPAAPPGALLNFLTPYLSGGVVKNEYASRLAVVLDTHPGETRALVGTLVGTSLADEFCDALREPGFSQLIRMARRFRRGLFRCAFFRDPVRSTAGFLSCVYESRVRSLFKSRGLTVAMLGTDGTGKTTLGEELHAELRPSFRSAWNRTMKLRPGLLPQLGRFLGRKPTESEYSRPHRAKPSGTLGTWFRATYYWLDYTVGYAFKVLPLRRRNTLILFDRWIDDWIVDPARYRMKPNSRYVRWLVAHSPRPDLVLVTTAMQKTVRERKQEVSARETLRQLTAYERYADTLENAFVIDTSISVDRSVDAATLALLARSQGHVAATTIGWKDNRATEGPDAPTEDMAA